MMPHGLITTEKVKIRRYGDDGDDNH
jgi:hypothetical protein